MYWFSWKLCLFRFNTLCSLFSPRQLCGCPPVHLHSPFPIPSSPLLILHIPFCTCHAQCGVFPIWPPLDVRQIENFAKQNIAAVAVGAGSQAAQGGGGRTSASRGGKGFWDKQKPFGLVPASGTEFSFWLCIITTIYVWVYGVCMVYERVWVERAA